MNNARKDPVTAISSTRNQSGSIVLAAPNQPSMLLYGLAALVVALVLALVVMLIKR